MIQYSSRCGGAAQWPRRVGGDLSPRKFGFDPKRIYVGFVVDKMVLQHAFVRVLRFFPGNIILPIIDPLSSASIWANILLAIDSVVNQHLKTTEIGYILRAVKEVTC